MFPKSPRQIALITVLAAVCLAIQLTPRPPNVEFTSLLTFLVGFLQGSAIGGLFGVFIMFVNGFLSSWGFAGLMMPFQMVGMAVAGIFGGLYKRFMRDSSSTKFSFEVTILGSLIALLYDVITNVGVAISFTLVGMPPLWALFLAFSNGAFFSLIHVGSNAVVFGIIFLRLTKALNKFLGGEAIWLRKEPLYSQH